jgi:hypothetical protein
MKGFWYFLEVTWLQETIHDFDIGCGCCALAVCCISIWYSRFFCSCLKYSSVQSTRFIRGVSTLCVCSGAQCSRVLSSCSNCIIFCSCFECQ